jgi:hypothetical protein
VAVPVVCALLLLSAASTASALDRRGAGVPTRVRAAAGWCGGAEETAVDRPDIVGGAEIHVVYARAADVPDHFAEDAPKIVRDLAGVDAWWRGQDPTRTPRFDFAPFLFCDSKFGTLDISSVQLASTNATYGSLGLEAFTQQVGSELTAAIQAANPGQQFMTGKKYLVYLDAADSFAGQCGVTSGDRDRSGPSWPSIVELQPAPGADGSCDTGLFGSGSGYPAATAAHELVHNFDMPLPIRPHACFLAPEHVCDSSVDLMFGGNPPVSSITELHLDVGHDDYYETPGPQYDVRTSAWLTHLDATPRTLTLAVAPRGAGTVHVSGESFSCTDRCTQTFDDGAQFSAWEEAAPGYAFDRWTGGCVATELVCNGTVSGDGTAVARFVRLVSLRVAVKGNGRVARVGDLGIEADQCRRRCEWPLPDHSQVVLEAHPARHMVFVGWQGTGCRKDGTRCSLKASPRAHPVAVFEPA